MRGQEAGRCPKHNSPFLILHSTFLISVLNPVFDSVLAAIGLLFLLPMFIVVAILIRVDSRGPIFFAQTRIGKGGRPFKFYKFRSMTVGSDKDSDREKTVVEFMNTKTKVKPAGKASTKIVNESRVTPIGRFLRKTSLDELPQLFNVLKGDMSLVGPRPTSFDVQTYDLWHTERLEAMPGLTGLWQVSGKNRTTFERMIELDVRYAENLSLRQDLWIILKTFGALASQCRDLRGRLKKAPECQAQPALRPANIVNFQKT